MRDLIEIAKEIARSSVVRGESAMERKQLYLEKNTIGVPLDQKITRRFKAKHLLPDMELGKLTLPEISIKGVGCKLASSGENPFRDHEFVDDDGTIVTVPFMADYYGACWSLTHQICMSSHSNYERLDDEIGITSTVRKVLGEFMNERNTPFYLKYWCGRISYDTAEALEAWKQAARYWDLADSEGFRALRSLLVLPDTVDDEEEVRFVYTHWNHENEFTRTSTEIREEEGIKLFHQPFRWQETVDEVYMDPDMPQVKKEMYEERFRRIWPNCPIAYR